MNALVIVKWKNSENTITECPEPLKFIKIAFKNFKMEVSLNNICEKCNNNKLKYHIGQEGFYVIIPDGLYTLTRLNLWLKHIFFNNEHLIFKNFEEEQKVFDEYESPIQIGEVEEDKFSIKLKENYKIDLTIGNFHKVLRFKAKTHEKLANIQQI